MERIAQALHECLMHAEPDELRELAASINAWEAANFNNKGYVEVQKRKALFVAMTEALDIAYDGLGWKDISQPQP